MQKNLHFPSFFFNDSTYFLNVLLIFCCAIPFKYPLHRHSNEGLRVEQNLGFHVDHWTPAACKPESARARVAPATTTPVAGGRRACSGGHCWRRFACQAAALASAESTTTTLARRRRDRPPGSPPPSQHRGLAALHRKGRLGQGGDSSRRLPMGRSR